jgi:RNA polymerase sigma-70 factor (ECF subfamily)
MTRETPHRCCFSTPLLRRSSNAEEPDESLMDRIARGEQSALETLLARHSKLITTVILNVIHNEAEAKDVLMEVFHQAWIRASKYSVAKGKARAWLVTIARRRGIDRLRKRESYSRTTDRFKLEVEHDPEAWISGRDPNGNSERVDTRSFIRSKLLELPPFQKEAIELAFLKGMSQREVAIHTGNPIGTIKARIELGLKKLRISLNELSLTNLGALTK